MQRDEAAYLGKLVRLGCIACRIQAKRAGLDYDPPDPSLQWTVVHHPREGQGGAQRAQNWLAIPLCPPHHTGRPGVHMNGNTIPSLKMDEMDLLAETIALYVRTYGA